MRELDVCQALLSQVLQLAERHGATQVESIVVEVGVLAGVEPALLADAFPFTSAGTAAEGAELVIETVPLRVRCPHCGAETEVAVDRRHCGVCGEHHTEIIAGDAVRLVDIGLAQPGAAATRH